jgi:S-adenosylmethionine:tRNA ribosyltransferase-isomerase
MTIVAPGDHALEAHEPPEVHGRDRADVALLVADPTRGSLHHTRFDRLPRLLRPGDLLVVNTSATLPAALPAVHAGRPAELRLATPDRSGAWVAELRTTDGDLLAPPPVGSRLELPAGAHAVVVAAIPGSGRLAVVRFDLVAPFLDYLGRHGRPIRYRYVPAVWPLDAYQTVFALDPGSAEMPSAGRPFTLELVTELVARGVLIAPITLHTGLSSPEPDEPPTAERYRVPAATAQLVNAVRGWRRRVIAVGTTVVRALETTVRRDGTVAAGGGWTDHVVTPRTGVRAVDGLLTGWHDPESTHLQLVEAVAGSELADRSYREARAHDYRRHEFGDLHLVLPSGPVARGPGRGTRSEPSARLRSSATDDQA